MGRRLKVKFTINWNEPNRSSSFTLIELIITVCHMTVGLGVFIFLPISFIHGGRRTGSE